MALIGRRAWLVGERDVTISCCSIEDFTTAPGGFSLSLWLYGCMLGDAVNDYSSENRHERNMLCTNFWLVGFSFVVSMIELYDHPGIQILQVYGAHTLPNSRERR